MFTFITIGWDGWTGGAFDFQCVSTNTGVLRRVLVKRSVCEDSIDTSHDFIIYNKHKCNSGQPGI